MGLFDHSSSSAGRFWPGRILSPSLNEIDLRKEMHDLLWGTYDKPQRGHWMVYRRFDVTRKVDGYDEVFMVGPEVAPGETRPANWPYRDELVITRQDLITDSPGANEINTPPGVLPQGQFTNYFEYSFQPYLYDQLFDIKWDDHRIKPPDSILNGKYERKYNIKNVFSYRSDGGRIEYWYCNSNYDLINP